MGQVHQILIFYFPLKYGKIYIYLRVFESWRGFSGVSVVVELPVYSFLKPWVITREGLKLWEYVTEITVLKIILNFVALDDVGVMPLDYIYRLDCVWWCTVCPDLWCTVWPE